MAQTITIGSGSSNQCPAKLTKGTAWGLGGNTSFTLPTDGSSVITIGAGTSKQPPALLTKGTAWGLGTNTSFDLVQ